MEIKVINTDQFGNMYDKLDSYISYFLYVNKYDDECKKRKNKIFLDLLGHLGLNPGKYSAFKDYFLYNRSKFIFLIIFAHFENKKVIYEFYNGMKILLNKYPSLSNLRIEIDSLMEEFGILDNSNPISWNIYLQLHPDIDADLQNGKIFSEWSEI